MDVDKKERARERVRKYQANNLDRCLWRNARSRAKHSLLDFSIDVSDCSIPDICPILGTRFVVGTMSAASLDRIDNTKGYIKGNVQVISRRANTMKGDCTPEQLKLFAEWIIKYYGND